MKRLPTFKFWPTLVLCLLLGYLTLIPTPVQATIAQDPLTQINQVTPNANLSFLAMNNNLTTMKATTPAADNEITIGDFVYDNNSKDPIDHNIIVLKYVGIGGAVTMPENVTIDGTVYQISSANNVFQGNSAVTSITTNSSLTSMGYNFASDCPNLTHVTLNSGLKTVGGYAFYNSGLTTITIPNTVTTLTGGTFAQCSDLKTVLFETGSRLTELNDSTFENCTTLTDVTIPRSVQTIDQYVFRGDSALTLDFEPDAQLQSISTQAFFNTHNLDSLTFPKTLQSIGDAAFQAAFNKQQQATITFEAGSQLTTIGTAAFAYNNALVGTLNLPEGLTTMGQTAFVSTGLTGVTFPSTLTEIPEQAFTYAQLKTLHIPGTVKTVGYEAFSVEPIQTLTIDEGVQVIGEEAFSFIQANTVQLPSTITAIGAKAFWSGKLESVTIPEQTSLGVTPDNLGDVFSWNNLTTVATTPTNSALGAGALTFNGQNCYKHLSDEYVGQNTLSIDALFSLYVDGTANQADHLKLENFTNGVAYNSNTHTFKIPKETTSFSFFFSGELTSGTNEPKAYNGFYYVDFSDSTIVAKDIIVQKGATWQPEDNFISATDSDGQAIAFDKIKVDPTSIDTTVLGKHPITYSYGSASKTVNTWVVENTTDAQKIDVNLFKMGEDGTRTRETIPGAPTYPALEGFIPLGWSQTVVDSFNGSDGTPYYLIGATDVDGVFTYGADTQSGTFDEYTGTTRREINFYYAPTKSAVFTVRPADLDFGQMRKKDQINTLQNKSAIQFSVGSAVTNYALSLTVSDFLNQDNPAASALGTALILSDPDINADLNSSAATTKPPVLAPGPITIQSGDNTPTQLLAGTKTDVVDNTGNWQLDLNDNNTSLKLVTPSQSGHYQATLTWTLNASLN